MDTLGNILNGRFPVTQSRPAANRSQLRQIMDATTTLPVTYNPTQRLENQLKTASQVETYATSKSLAGGRGGRGKLFGLTETLG